MLFAVSTSVFGSDLNGNRAENLHSRSKYKPQIPLCCLKSPLFLEPLKFVIRVAASFLGLIHVGRHAYVYISVTYVFVNAFLEWSAVYTIQ